MSTDVLFQLTTQTQVNAPPGQTLLIVGTCDTIPVSASMVPFLFSNPRAVTKFYGSGMLSNSYYEAWRQGAPWIATMGIPTGTALSAVFDVLVNFDVDLVCLPEWSYSQDVAAALSAYQLERNSLGYPTVCVVPITGGYSDLTSIDPAVIQSELDYDGSNFTVLTAGYLKYRTNTMRQYTVNAASAMAGLIAALPPATSVVNKPVASVTVPAEWTDAQVPVLFSTGYNFVTISPKYGPVMMGGRTLNQQDYLDLTNARLAQLTSLSLRNALMPYVGEAPSVSRIRSVIDATMGGLVAQGSLSNYDYTIAYDGPSGTVSIGMNIVPVFNVRSISVTVNINLQRTFV